MKIAVLGYGTVGRSICKYIEGDSKDIQVAYVLRRPGKATEPFMTEDFDEILNDPSVGIVVDALSGRVDSYDYMKRALLSGKHVVTANKAAVAYGMEELCRIAVDHNVNLKYEATSAGTIPIVAEIVSTTHTNYLSAVYGILNGTTNFIIDKMLTEGSEFDATLKEAQRLGYAEADPTADIGGFDVKNKIIILASTAYHGFVTGDIPVFGIELLTKKILDDYAAKGKTIKLMGISVRKDNDYALGVVPCVIDLDSLEAHVPLNNNIVTIVGDMCGELKFYGQGAGGAPTADALLRDIYSIFNSVNIDVEFQFFRKLNYVPEMLKGAGYIGNDRVEGTLEEIVAEAKRRNEFVAFECPELFKA